MSFLYPIGIFFYIWAVKAASLFNSKAKLWVGGRKNLWKKLAELSSFSGKTIWVHCASLGEFEQGRPVMEAIKKQYPNTRIILTFFSPSGYEIRKNYAGADAIFYLPADLPGAASRFYDAIKPDIGLIIKYEFWQGYLHEAKKRNIPLFLISGIFRKDMMFFTPYGNYFRQGLQAFEQFFIQDENSFELLQSINIKNITVCGDTRLDRVLEAVEKRMAIPIIEQFKAEQLLWVCGSTWPADDKMIASIAKEVKGKLKILIVPHDIHPDYLDKLISNNPGISISKFSNTAHTELSKIDVLIMDTMGMLTSAYAYADFVYVGGGFGKAVHNTMEPAAYGVPVLFGPAHQKFREINGLMGVGGGECVNSKQELETIVETLIQSVEKRIEMGKAARKYVENNAGATPLILTHLQSYLH